MPIAPKLPEMTGEVAAAARAHFASMIHRPLVIIGNGPSAAFPRYDALPEDPVIFRMNWFFLESHYFYGRRADAYFWSVYNKALHEKLFETGTEGSYDIGSYFCPFKVPEDGADVFHVYGRAFAPQFDHWALISGNPRLARFMMSRPLPTQGFQALACALELGFTDITLVGLDLYDESRPRYGYVIPDAVRAGLAEKDVAGGYEAHHELAHDIAFLKAIRTEFPAARLRAVNCHPLIDPQITEAVHAEGGIDPDELGVPPKRSQRAIERWFTPKTPIAGSWYKEIAGLRCAFVTLCTGDFHWGVQALANSLRKVSDVPLIVVTDKATDIARFTELGAPILTVEGITNPADKMARFADTYTKLSVFGFEQWDRLVFLDADTIVLRNIDDLFVREGFCAAPDIGMGLNSTGFNSGVFKLDPSLALFDRMMTQVPEIDSYDGGDQGFLNQFFADWSRLDPAYNALRRVYDHLPSLFDLDEIKVLHFVGPKPWHTLERKNNAYKFIDDLWFEQLDKDQLIALCSYLRALPIRAKDARFAALAFDELTIEGKAALLADEAATAGQATVAPGSLAKPTRLVPPRTAALPRYESPGPIASLIFWFAGKFVGRDHRTRFVRDRLGLDRTADEALLGYAMRRLFNLGDATAWAIVAGRLVSAAETRGEQALDGAWYAVLDRLVRAPFLFDARPEAHAALIELAERAGADRIVLHLPSAKAALNLLVRLGTTPHTAGLFDAVMAAFGADGELALSLARRAVGLSDRGEIGLVELLALSERLDRHREALRRIEQAVEMLGKARGA